MNGNGSSNASIATIWSESLIVAVMLLLQLNSCDKPEPICLASGIIPEQPYEYPIWHPSGSVIGFNHKPIKEVLMTEGLHGCKSHPVNYSYYEDSIGFWLIDIDGTRKRRVLPYTLQTPAWSPNGNWIAFVRNAQIFKMPFDGHKFDTTQIEQLTFEGLNFFPAWSPDGEWIAFDSNTESVSGLKFIWKMRNNGSSKVRLTYTPQQGETRMPGWGLDFSLVHIRYMMVDNGSPEIFKMDSAGNNSTRLTNNLLVEQFPKFSCQGNIGFIEYSQQAQNLVVVNSDGARVHTFSGIEMSNFDWSPDGKKILFQKAIDLLLDKEEGTLWVMDFDGANQKQLTFNFFIVA